MTKKNLILFGFILLKFLLQYFLISSDHDLQRDEYLHLDQAQHLAWGFQSVPPFTSWISYIINLLGDTIFWVKFFPALFGALTIFIVWKAIEELNGNLFALILGAYLYLVFCPFKAEYFISATNKALPPSISNTVQLKELSQSAFYLLCPFMTFHCPFFLKKLLLPLC
jgi:hypothetical protein